jgi:transcriptional regulator GlxA family with amidase domain
MLVFPQMVLLDAAGPCEVFSMANRAWRELHPELPEPYQIEIVSTGIALRIDTASGLTLMAGMLLADFQGNVDTLLIPGGTDLTAALHDANLLHWLREIAPQVRRVGSICTGAFVLAAAGLLDGLCVTTHWQDCERLAREFPRTCVEPDRIYVRDGNIYTSAGVTAGIDLALALVEEDLGRNVALKVAQTLVMFVRRPGGQSQFSSLLDSLAGERQPLRDLVVWVAEHLDQDLSVEALAARVNMSVRNFSRTFRRGFGKTPARFVEALRVDAARRLMEQSDARMEHIARECGLRTGNAMRRSFLRVVGVAPSDYREQLRQHA